VLDNDADAIRLDAPVIGFDMTAVLDHPEVRGPLMAYLFHRCETLIDGRRVIFAIDEFWKALGDPAFRDLVHDKLKTLRKRNAPMFLATQSARDALNSPIAHTIVEQCPNQIHLPNPRADAQDFIGGLKLTEPEFRMIKEDMAAGGRRFLLKQGPVSVVCELDLSDSPDLVAVLSARQSTVRLMERLIGELGPQPEAWLPAFKAQWREVVAG
jgi:type IV secretion system protein VirB4